MTIDLNPLIHTDLLQDGRSGILAKLDKREMVYGLGIRNARTTDIVLMAKSAGYNVIWMDLEHSAMTLDVCAHLSSAALSLGITPIVRVPERDYGIIGRVLDGGAMGIFSPRMETAEQAAELANACRFSPVGERSQIGALPLFGMRKVPTRIHNDLCNQTMIVMALIESETGIANVHKIAAVKGVDIVVVGSNDLSAEMGIPGEYRHPRMRAAYQTCIDACAAHGKHFYAGGMRDLAYQQELRHAGASTLLFTGIDSEMLRDSIQNQLDIVRASVGSKA